MRLSSDPGRHLGHGAWGPLRHGGGQISVDVLDVVRGFVERLAPYPEDVAVDVGEDACATQLFGCQSFEQRCKEVAAEPDSIRDGLWALVGVVSEADPFFAIYRSEAGAVLDERKKDSVAEVEEDVSYVTAVLRLWRLPERARRGGRAGLVASAQFLEGGHLAEDPCGGLDQGDGQEPAGALAEAEAEVEQGAKTEVIEGDRSGRLG